MPKFKALILFAVVVTLSFALFGCGLVASITGSGSEEIIESSGALPEWLLLSHRSAEGPGSDLDEALAEEDLEEDEETDQAVGGTDEDDGIVAESTEASQDTSGSTQQTSAPTTPSSSEDSGSSSFEECKPGMKEYAFYFANRNPGETCAQFRKRIQAVQAEKEEAEEQAGWFEGSPSGWGNTDD